MPLFCHSNFSYDSKPANPAPLQRKRNYKQEELTIEQIAEMCGSGYAWRAGIYDMSGGTFKKKDVKANQIIALDFDAIDTPPEAVAEYAINIGIPANFYYYSYSMNPKNAYKSGRIDPTTYKYLISNREKTDDFAYKNGFNFRLVFILERAVKPPQYENAVRTMLDVFEQFKPDKATKDSSRLWYGGKLGSEVLSTEPLKLSALGALSAHVKVKEGVEPRKAMNQKKGFIPEYADIPEPEAVTVGEGWYQYLNGRCDLLNRFKQGEYLDYNERLSLFSNLKYLRYNTKEKTILKDVLEWFNPKTYEGHSCDENQIRAKFRDCSLKPVPIVRGRGGVYVTIPEFFSSNINEPIIPANQKVSLADLDKWMDENCKALLDDKEGDIKLLKSQTGSGKTKRIIDWLLSNPNLKNQKVIYASPKHSNLKEFEERFLAQASFPQRGLIHRCPEKEVNQQDILYLQMGLPAKTKSVERKGFIDKLFNVDDKGVFLMTHSLLTALSGLSPDLIIIDEEIDSSLIKETKIELSALGGILPFVDADTGKQLVDFIDDIKSRRREDGLNIDLSFLRDKVAPQLEKQIDEYIKVTNAGNLACGFFECYENDGKLSTGKAGTNCIRIVRKSTLISDAITQKIPVRIFTATPMNARTENYYSAKISVVEAPLATNEGRIIQYRGVSGAKGINGDKLPVLAGYIKSKLPQETIDNSCILTFKCRTKEENDFWIDAGFRLAEQDGTQIHLANNSGLDCLKGRQIIVAGKYDLPDQYYQDIWDDISPNPAKLTRQNQRLDINGVEQNLYLFTEPVMKNIQQQNIQQAVEQATGRARALRQEGAIVYLFCNYCISDVDEVYD